MNVIVVESHGRRYKAYFGDASHPWGWGASRVEAIGRFIRTYGQLKPLEIAAMGLKLKVLD